MKQAKTSVTSNGSVWIDIPTASGTSRVGLSASNILSPDSDPTLAYEILLERTARVLKSPKHSRETMLEFKEDWAILKAAQSRFAASVADADLVPKSTKPVAENK